MPDMPVKRIIFVEDDPDICTIVQMALKYAAGIEVICCEAQELPEKIKEIKPDLLLLDVMLPGISGLELLKEIRKTAEGKNIPAVFLTASHRPATEAEIKDLSIAGIILKPFDPLKLYDQIKDIYEKI